MKNILAAAIVTLSSLLAPQASAAMPIQATVTLPHDNVLPGVPFDLVVTYTNVSNQPVTVRGALATLVVTFGTGDAVVMNAPDVNDQWDLVFAIPARLAPGQSVQQAASWADGSIPNWFQYSSFSGPGTYGIALELRIADENNDVLGTVRTPAVTVTRVEPVGVDAELWKRMQEMSAGAWADNSFAATKPGLALANEIMQLHPSSGYYPYVVSLRAFRSKDKNHIPVLLEAAERFPSSPAYPYLLKAAADSARYEAWMAEEQRDEASAQKYFSLAQSKYSDALATKSIAIRESAEKGLRDVGKGFERAKTRAR